MSSIRQLPNAAHTWERLSPEAQNEIMTGDIAIRRIREREDYGRWVQVGRALLRLQEEALHLSGANEPYGRRYTAVRGELGNHVPDLEALDKASKAHATWLAKNFEAVEEWRATLTANQLDTMNHPSVVKRRYDAAHKVKEPKLPTAGKKDQALGDLQQENDTLSGEMAEQRREFEQRETQLLERVRELEAENARLREELAARADAETVGDITDEPVTDIEHGDGDAVNEPVPEVVSDIGNNSAPRPGRRGKYPFGECIIGVPIFIKTDQPQKSIAARATNYGNRHGMKFSTHAVDGGVQVTRTA